MTDRTKMIRVTGRITDRYAPGGARKVRGYAFQVPGFEWFHTWATPYDLGGWVATHWESGLSVGANEGVRGDRAKDIPAKVAAFLNAEGVKRVRCRMKELGWMK